MAMSGVHINLFLSHTHSIKMLYNILCPDLVSLTQTHSKSKFSYELLVKARVYNKRESILLPYTASKMSM